MTTDHRLKYLANVQPDEIAADEVNVSKSDSWNQWLARVNESSPTKVQFAMGKDGFIRRKDLYEAAEEARTSGSAEALWSLFWSVLAWGSGGDFRRIPSIARAISDAYDDIQQQLATAQLASFNGELSRAFNILAGPRYGRRLIRGWGPAYFTKFLAFTSDPASEVPALILDDRVRVAWACLTDDWIREDFTAFRYTEFCTVDAVNARAIASLESTNLVEIRLFLLGQKVGSYERWLRAERDLLRERFGAVGVGSQTIIDRIAADAT